MHAAALLLAAALPVPRAAASAADAHAEARAVYEETLPVIDEGKSLLRDLETLRGRYRADMDRDAVGAERAALHQRIADMAARYQRLRRRLLELRKQNQHGQLIRLLEQVPKEQFGAGLLEALEFDRMFGDLSGFSRRVETALSEDDAAFAGACREADARDRRILATAAGALVALLLVVWAALPARRRLTLPPPGPDAPRLE